MRLYMTILCSLVLVFTSFEAKSQEMNPKPVFEVYEYDFGDLKEGEKRAFVFEFENKGNVPFIISDVHVQCGCTAPEWSKEPILPNQKGSIKIVYNSAGKEGVQRKIITIKSNYAELIKLKILANVLTD